MKSSNESNYYSASNGNANNNLNTLPNEATKAVETINPKAPNGKQVPRGVNRRAATNVRVTRARMKRPSTLNNSSNASNYESANSGTDSERNNGRNVNKGAATKGRVQRARMKYPPTLNNISLLADLYEGFSNARKSGGGAAKIHFQNNNNAERFLQLLPLRSYRDEVRFPNTRKVKHKNSELVSNFHVNSLNDGGQRALRAIHVPQRNKSGNPTQSVRGTALILSEPHNNQLHLVHRNELRTVKRLGGVKQNGRLQRHNILRTGQGMRAPKLNPGDMLIFNGQIHAVPPRKHGDVLHISYGTPTKNNERHETPDLRTYLSYLLGQHVTAKNIRSLRKSTRQRSKQPQPLPMHPNTNDSNY